MVRLIKLREIGDYFYINFKIRRMLFFSLLLLSIVPGTFIYLLPIEVRLLFTYIFVSMTVMSILGVYGMFKGIISMTLTSILFSRKYSLHEYSAPGLKHLIRKMNLLGKVKIYVTSNPAINSPFVNIITSKVYVPVSWLKQYPPKEVLSTLSHEFEHIKTRRRYGYEMFLSFGFVLMISLILAFYTLLFIVEIAEFSMLMLALTFVSRRNEIRADFGGSKAIGPEGLISVFEQIKGESINDYGSETHPSFEERIARLTKLLD